MQYTMVAMIADDEFIARYRLDPSRKAQVGDRGAGMSDNIQRKLKSRSVISTRLFPESAIANVPSGASSAYRGRLNLQWIAPDRISVIDLLEPVLGSTRTTL
jgi:hypothetical protein